MSLEILKKIRNRLLFKKKIASYSTIVNIRLKRLADSCNEYIRKNNIRQGLRILWPTTFNLSKEWWIHDGIMSAALRIRGADIIPTICDRVQSDECVFYAGEWQGSGKPGFHERRDANCKQCMRNDKEMWRIWGLRPLHLTSFVTTGEVMHARAQVSEWIAGNWEEIELNGFRTGYEAWKAVTNNNLQSCINESLREEDTSLAFHHLFNINVLMLAYNRIFDIMKPERVFGNGGFYYYWGVVHHIAMQRNIPYFRYFRTGFNPLAWNYARNCLDFYNISPTWQTWLKEPWTQNQEQRVNHDLNVRQSLSGTRKGWLTKKQFFTDLKLSDNSLQNNKRSTKKDRHIEITKHLKVDISKPIALAPVGVSWDATSHVSSKAFDSMYDWVFKTISWFANQPQWQLIIRAHPGENFLPHIAAERRVLLERELHIKGIEIPKNVYIVPSAFPLSTNDLMTIAKVGIVYTSSTGLEMSCAGLPVVVVGPTHYRNKGFTFDPSSLDEYYTVIDNILSGKIVNNSKESSLLAKRYWYLFTYYASVETGLVEFDKNYRHVPKELTCEDILPGANEYIDYVCDSVINDLPIMGENRWPPERK